MRKSTIAVLSLAAVTIANANSLSLWAGTNPVTPSSVGDVPVAAIGTELTLWAEVAIGDVWQGIGFDLGTTGVPIIDDLTFFGGTLHRWSVLSDFGPIGSPSDVGVIALPGLDGGNTGLGGNLDLTEGSSFGIGENGGNIFKVGTITANESIGILTASYLGMVRQGALEGEDTIYVGADSFLNNAEGSTATLWTPEPASLVLITLASLVIRRR